jgi:serine/threonine protein phosphatase PrpC
MLRVLGVFKKSDTGRQRRANEDNLFVAEPLFVVADGMGGARAGEVASQTAVDAFGEGLPEAGSAEERLSTVIRDANGRIHGMAQGDEQLAGMGTTVTAALLGGKEISIAHVGDSRAYVWRDGELHPLTRDHSLVAELVARGKLTEEQAAEHPQRSIITRALGPEADVEVETRTYPVRPGDVYLLCSDGLTSMIDDATVASVLREAPSLDAAGDALIAAANEAGGRDNITVVLFSVEDDGTCSTDEQPTGASDAVVVADGQTTKMTSVAPRTVETEAPASPGTPAVAEPPRRTAPRAQKEAPPAPKRRRLRLRGLVTAIVGLVLVGILVAAGVLYARQSFFVGKSDTGFVTVYRGLDASPFGVNLYSTYCTSPLRASDVQQLASKRLDRSSRDKQDAVSLVRTMYREKLLADARAKAAATPKKKPTTKDSGGKDSSGGSGGSATAPAPQPAPVPPVSQLDEACTTG